MEFYYVFYITSTTKKINFAMLNTEWDPWGVADGYECEIIENDAPIPKQARHIPGPLPAQFYQTLEAVQTKRVEPKDAMHLLSHLVSRSRRSKMLLTVISENTELQC